MPRALLFINGNPPLKIPDLSAYQVIACTDGALRYLQKMEFPVERLTFVSGDFDSYKEFPTNLLGGKFIQTPDQNKTDFHKSLEILLTKGVTAVDVYGGSGGEQDHYLGNLSVAFIFKDQLTITFFDEYSRYFFIPNNFKESGVKGKMISLVPFPLAKKVVTKGLNWPLYAEDLDLTKRIGTRNFAIDDTFSCHYESGGLLVFIAK